MHLPPRTYVLSQYERIAFRTCADHVCGLLCVTNGDGRDSCSPLIIPLCERLARSATGTWAESECYIYL